MEELAGGLFAGELRIRIISEDVLILLTKLTKRSPAHSVQPRQMHSMLQVQCEGAPFAARIVTQTGIPVSAQKLLTGTLLTDVS